MDSTLTQILHALVEAHAEIDKLRQQQRELQAIVTDLKQRLEAVDALDHGLD